MKKNLKFNLELDEKGALKIEIHGDAMSIGKDLFCQFFANKEFTPYAAGISAALELSYPKSVKRQHSTTEQ